MSERCSIIIPTLNRRDRLLRTLRVLRAQDYPNLEIIVSDDGSGDGTALAVEELNDDRIAVVSHPTPSGVANARNRGIAASTGDYVAFCDDDDLWVTDKLSSQLEAMRRDGRRWAYCYSVLVDDELNYQSRDRGRPLDAFSHMILVGNQVPGGCSSVMTERSLLDEVGWFDPVLSMFADWELWIRMSEDGPPTVWDAAGVLYVVHREQMSMDTRKSRQELQLVRTKHEARMAGRQAWTPGDGYDPLDDWILRQLWLSGRWVDAARYFMRNPTLRTLGRDLRSTAKLCFERAQAVRVPELGPDETRALNSVRLLAGDAFGTAA